MSPLDRPAIATISLGSADHHSFESKLSAASQHGIKGIELCFDDLVQYARTRLNVLKTLPQPFSSSTPCNLYFDALGAAASDIRRLCQSYQIEIICLQPLRHIEGLEPLEFRQRLDDDVPLWIKLAHRLGTDLILIPSNFLPKSYAQTLQPANFERTSRQLGQIADIGARSSTTIRFAFEALAWGRDVNEWEQSWDAVKRANRPNLGICLDTFNICGKVWADPQHRTGVAKLLPDARLKRSLDFLKTIVPLEKIFIVQIADAEKLEELMIKGQNKFWVDGHSPLMSWSRNYRLFYGETEKGAYMPVNQVLQTVLEMGYKGWISHEVFNRSLDDSDQQVPNEHARRAYDAWQQMRKGMANLDGGQEQTQANVETGWQSGVRNGKVDWATDNQPFQQPTGQTSMEPSARTTWQPRSDFTEQPNRQTQTPSDGHRSWRPNGRSNAQQVWQSDSGSQPYQPNWNGKKGVNPRLTGSDTQPGSHSGIDQEERSDSWVAQPEVDPRSKEQNNQSEWDASGGNSGGDVQW